MGNKSIIILGLLAILLGGYLIYSGYEAQAPTTAFAGWVGVIGGALLLLFGFARKSSENDNSAKSPAFEPANDAQNEIVIKSMVYVAMADNRLAKRESKTVSRICKSVLEQEVATSLIEGLCGQLQSGQPFLAELEAARTNMDSALKTKIVQTCYLVIVSDLDFSNAEDKRMNEIGAALGLSQDETDNIIAAIST